MNGEVGVDLVDSSVWIDYFRDRPGTATDHLDARLSSGNLPRITEPIVMEVLAGVRERELLALERVVDGLPLLAVDPELDYRNAAAIFRAARSAGRPVRNTGDCLIAAIAQRHGARVVHRDRDFEAIAQVTPLRTLDLR